MTVYANETPTAYYLTESLLNENSFEIDADQYATLSEALTTVISAMDIEELFQVFAQSFLRFEKDLLDVSFEYAFANESFPDADAFMSNIQHRFNVNIITILTVFKSYDDHCNRILKSLINLHEMKAFNDEIRKRTYDTHLSYRICDQLRNYAQHRALPLGGFTIGSSTNFGIDKAGKKIKLDSGFNVSPWLNVLNLRNSPKCKATLREELINLGHEKIDMKWLIRSFAGAVCERHAALRAFLKPQIIDAGEKITTGYKFASDTKGSEARFLVLIRDDEEQPMRGDLAGMVLTTFETYPNLAHAANLYVTSQITPEVGIYCG